MGVGIRERPHKSSNHHRIHTKRQSCLEPVPRTAVGALHLSNTCLYGCRVEVHVLDRSLWPVKKATLAYYPVIFFFSFKCFNVWKISITIY